MNADRTIYDISDFDSDPVRFSTALFLLTIERSDEDLHSEDPNSLREALSGIEESDFVTLTSIVKNSEPKSYTAAAKTLTESWEKESHRRVLVPFILTAVASGRLSPSANHLLRLISRMAFGNEAPLVSVFAEMTGSPLASPGDPSSLDWWHDQSTPQAQDVSTVSAAMNPQRALLILGLQGDVTRDAIKSAYSKMVRSLYPDRFAAQEEETLKEASLIFREIHLAYEHLIS